MVDTHDPEEVLNEAKRERKESIENAQEALKFFLEEIDGLIEWGDVESELATYIGITRKEAKDALAQIVGDIVDPVQQIGAGEDRFVGIIDFVEFPDAGAYGYTHYSDTHGRRNRVVCAKCIQEKESDSEVAHATQGEGTNAEHATWEQLLNKVTSHYADAHESAPEEIDIGASLVSGTTIGGNQAWHNGNVTGGSNVSISGQDISIDQGDGSGLDADTVDGTNSSELGGNIIDQNKTGSPNVFDTLTYQFSYPLTPPFTANSVTRTTGGQVKTPNTRTVTVNKLFSDTQSITGRFDAHVTAGLEQVDVTGTISINNNFKANTGTFLSGGNSASATLFTTINTQVTTGDTVTCKVRADDRSFNGFEVSIAARAYADSAIYDTITGSNTAKVTANTSFSPLWVRPTGPFPPGVSSDVQFLNGSEIRTQTQLFNSISVGDNLTASFQYSNVNSKTTFQRLVKLYEGRFI